MCRFGAKFSEFPNIKKYVATLKVGQATETAEHVSASLSEPDCIASLQERPSVQASWPPHWKDTPSQDWLTV